MFWILQQNHVFLIKQLNNCLCFSLSICYDLFFSDVIGQLVENNNITVIDPEDKPKQFLEFKLQDLR